MKPDFDFILCSHASNFKEQKGAISLKLHHEYNKCKKEDSITLLSTVKFMVHIIFLNQNDLLATIRILGKKKVKVLKEILCEFDRLDNSNSSQKHLKSQRLVIYF